MKLLTPPNDVLNQGNEAMGPMKVVEEQNGMNLLVEAAGLGNGVQGAENELELDEVGQYWS